MKVIHFKKSPPLEYIPTTSWVKLNFPVIGCSSNDDEFRICVNGIPERVPYIFNKAEDTYYAETCHRFHFYEKIKMLKCTEFPDKGCVNILLDDNIGLVSSYSLARKGSVFTAGICVAVEYNSIEGQQWGNVAYLTELRKQLELSGFKMVHFMVEDQEDGVVIEATYDFSLSATIQKNVAKTHTLLKRAIAKTEQALPKRKKPDNDFRIFLN